MDKLLGNNPAVVAKQAYVNFPIWLTNDDDPVQQVNQLLLNAVEQHVSDIHIEPYCQMCRIRFRQDGLLYDFTCVEFAIANSITARLKALCHLDVAEKRIPQDGHFSMALLTDVLIDFRLSTCPTIHGEKTVIRILNPTITTKQIDELGLEENQKQVFFSALEKSQGLILFSGPTGCGKTVSMYAALQHLNRTEKNILTVEDPVEINIAGINQVNINPKAGLTFPALLKAFLRQDPDVIMLGEIRDAKTAQTAIRAAQTGHLILSTVHASNAVQTLDRLLNLGLDKSLLESELLLLVAQRLIRKLCTFCKKPVELTKEILQKYNLTEQSRIFAPVGCQQCRLGYRGRVGIFEMLPFTPEAGAKFSQLDHRALLTALLKKYGLSLRMAGLYKVTQGITSLEEIERVIASFNVSCFGI